MKLFVLARQDLNRQYANVQAGHALAQFLLDHQGQHSWENGTLVYLKAGSETDLMDWQQRLSNDCIPHSTFREEDLDDQLTAIAALPSDECIFSGLRLL